MFAAICDLTGKPIAMADYHKREKTMRMSTVGTESLAIAAKVGATVGSNSSHRKLSAATSAEIRVYTLLYGRHVHVVATPAGAAGAGSAFAAVALLADLSARWDQAAVGDARAASQSRGPSAKPIALDDVGLHARLVHFATTTLAGDARLMRADVIAAGGSGGASPVKGSGGIDVDLGDESLASWSTTSPIGGKIVGKAPSATAVQSMRDGYEASRQTAAELRAARADELALQLSAKVSELEDAKKEMERHSKQLMDELRRSRESHLDLQRLHQASSATAAEKRAEQSKREQAEHQHAAEAWAGRVMALQDELSSTKAELSAMQILNNEARARWQAREEELISEIGELKREVTLAKEEVIKEHERGDSLKALLSRSRAPTTSSTSTQMELAACRAGMEALEDQVQTLRGKLSNQAYQSKVQVSALTDQLKFLTRERDQLAQGKALLENEQYRWSRRGARRADEGGSRGGRCRERGRSRSSSPLSPSSSGAPPPASPRSSAPPPASPRSPRSPGRISGRSPGRSADRSPGRSADRSPGRSADRPPGRGSERSPRAVRSTSASSGSSARAIPRTAASSSAITSSATASASGQSPRSTAHPSPRASPRSASAMRLPPRSSPRTPRDSPSEATVPTTGATASGVTRTIAASSSLAGAGRSPRSPRPRHDGRYDDLHALRDSGVTSARGAAPGTAASSNVIWASPDPGGRGFSNTPSKRLGSGGGSGGARGNGGGSAGGGRSPVALSADAIPPRGLAAIAAGHASSVAARSSGSGQKMTRSASQPASCLAGNSPRASAGSHSPMVRFRLSEDMSPSPSPRARNSGGRTSHGSAPTRAAATTSSGSARGASPTSRSSPERSPRGPNYPKGSDPPYPPHQPEVRLVMEPGTYKAPDELHRELVRPAGVHGVLAIMATAPSESRVACRSWTEAYKLLTYCTSEVQRKLGLRCRPAEIEGVALTRTQMAQLAQSEGPPDPLVLRAHSARASGWTTGTASDARSPRPPGVPAADMTPT